MWIEGDIHGVDFLRTPASLTPQNVHIFPFLFFVWIVCECVHTGIDVCVVVSIWGRSELEGRGPLLQLPPVLRYAGDCFLDSRRIDVERCTPQVSHNTYLSIWLIWFTDFAKCRLPVWSHSLFYEYVRIYMIYCVAISQLSTFILCSMHVH